MGIYEDYMGVYRAQLTGVRVPNTINIHGVGP